MIKKLLVKLFAVVVLLCGVSYAAGFDYGEPANSEEIAASHILVKTAAEAMQIKKELDNGGSFEYYAKLYSLCPSGRNGGALGYFGHGQMVPEFEKKAFSLQVGEVSEPVHTQFGWHLIKVTDRR